MGARTYAILGAGALGGLYGAMLQRAGAEVHFHLRSDCNQVRALGLAIDSPWGQFVLDDVKAYAAVNQMPQCDVVCVCLKTTANALLPEMLRSVAKPDSIVVLMQNGLGAEEELAQALPLVRIAGGLCYLCCNRLSPGKIQHLDYGQVTFAPFSSGIKDELNQIAADFQRAGVPVQFADDLHEARWRKLMWNIPFNGLSVVLNAGTEQIIADATSLALAKEIILEGVAGAQACGCALQSSYADWLIDFTRKMKPYKTSMKLDFDAKRPLEVEYLYRRPLQAAARAGCRMPRIAMLADQLDFLDAQNRS